jgi:hypothetical protein
MACMKFSARSTIAVLLVGLAACSGTAQKATPAARAQAGAQSASPPVAAAPGGNSAGVDRSLVKDGYRVVRRNGHVLYCRSQSVTGTKFSSTFCLTADEIHKEQEDLRQQKDALHKARAFQCLGPECGGG